MEQEQLNLSRSNSQKLDRLIILIEGLGPNDGGLLDQVQKHEVALYGEGERPGLITKVSIMWRVHIWLIATGAAIIGSVVTIILKK